MTQYVLPERRSGLEDEISWELVEKGAANGGQRLLPSLSTSRVVPGRPPESSARMTRRVPGATPS